MAANTANTDPIYSRAGAMGQSMILKAAATTDYTGVSPYTREVFASDATNGGFIQRIRFKALGTNAATVARIFINRGGSNTNFAPAPVAPTSTPSASGGVLQTGNYYAMVIAIGPNGQQSVIGAFSTAAAVTGPTGSISWAFTAVAGATSYRIYVSPFSTGTTYATFATRYFTTSASPYVQTTSSEMGTFDDPTVGNQYLYGELSLPATTASATVSTPEVDYPMNLALPPGYEVYVGIATAVVAGWVATGVGGVY